MKTKKLPAGTTHVCQCGAVARFCMVRAMHAGGIDRMRFFARADLFTTAAKLPPEQARVAFVMTDKFPGFVAVAERAAKGKA